MKRHLIWKLLGVNVLVIIFVIVMVWIAIDYLAADYFSVLMKVYHINPKASHAMFLSAAHRYLIWASLGGLVLSAILSFYLMRRVLTPLTRMTGLTRQISEGDYTTRIPVTSKDEVGQLAKAFNHMGENLEKIEHLRKTMILDAAHELRTPLTNIKGYLEALTDRVIPPNPATFSLLQEETERLVRLVEAILRLARADAAHRHVTPKKIILSEFIDKEIIPLEPLFDSKSIQVENHIPKEMLSVWADPDMLTQIFRNLFENGWQHTPSGGIFKIFTKKHKKGIIIICANTCGAIDQKDLPFLFERFYRADRSRSRDRGGAGIGLAIVKELVQAHGGKVFVNLKANVLQIGFSLPKFEISVVHGLHH
jgi:two-component system sensor histidine kinase BaeS